MWLEKHGDCWKVCYRTLGNRVRRLRGYADKTATQKLGQLLDVLHARNEQGLIDIATVPLDEDVRTVARKYIADRSTREMLSKIST